MAKYKIEIDKEKCIGCGTCAALCDEVFELKSDEGKAYIKKNESDLNCVKEAAESCPVQCISITNNK